MRILEVITLSELGGAQSVVANLANELASNPEYGSDNEIMVAAGYKDGKLWENLAPSIQRMPIKHLVRRITPLHDLLAILSLIRIYRKFKPDVIHLHSSKAGLLGRLAFPRRKIIYTVHGFDSIRVAYRKLLPIERIMQYFCHAIVAVSEYDYRNLKREKIHRNLHTIYNGISMKEDKLVHLNLPAHFTHTIVCIARMAKPKRLDIFLETARLLPQYAFVWIGNQENIPVEMENVFFLGNIPQASRHCLYADLFMLPSDFEGMPMVIIEAMSHHLPIVASNVGGISEIVKNGINGFVVENTAQNFAEKIKQILSQENWMQELGNNAYKIYQEKLTAKDMAQKYYQLYMDINQEKIKEYGRK